MRNLGDLVVMPLPTEWTPEVQSGGGPIPGTAPPIGSGVPGAGAGVIGFDQAGNPVYYGGGPVAAPPPTAWPPGSPMVVVPPPIGLTPAGQWTQSFLPDSVLPLPLQRTNPLMRRPPIYWQPGPWDHRLVRESAWWTYVKNHGGLKSCCRIPSLGAPIYNQPPWIVMPSNAEKLEQGFGVATPVGPFTGNDVLLGQFQVPDGWDGVITRFVPNFTGLGFQDYSGNIFWRLKVGNRFAPDLGNVNTTFGSLNQVSVPGINNIRMISGQNVYIYYNIPVGSPVGTGMITAAVFGWYWPRR